MYISRDSNICNIFHFIIAGNCYEKVREETERMKEAMGVDTLQYNAPHNEVVFLYEDDPQSEREKHKDKYVVDMGNKRPSWFHQSLLTPAKNRR